jgi:hypothetical protein
MGIIDQKAQIFGKIGAARTVAEGLPKLVTNPSFPSINNDGDGVAFLVDMLKSLVGIEKLRAVIVDTLAYKLDDMEIGIKIAMKLSLKELVNCGVDPSIPTYIKAGGTGILTKTNKVDFFDILKTDPISPEGNLLYTDTQASPLTTSNDYNGFLYGTIQNDGTVETWANILDVRFDSVNTVPTPNNTLTFNANASYNNKTLTDLNNDYIDSIDLFDSKNLLNKLLDDLFGSLSIKLKKTATQLQKEEQINSIIKNIINADEDDVVDDSFFTFTNEEVAAQEDAARWRSKGIRVIEGCKPTPVSIGPTTIDVVNATLSGVTSGQPKKDAFDNAITDIGGNIGGNADTYTDAYALELNFIENLIQGLIVSIVGFILSPKVISIFLINYKIVYGINEEYDDAADFMRQNKNLMKDVAKAVRNAIITVLLNTVLKEISSLVSTTIIEIATEKTKNQLAQILSLVGVPTKIIRLIKGL